ncbi:MAG: HIT family protein, partial [Candidatus Heimdallarchaeaceae archaeon]
NLTDEEMLDFANNVRLVEKTLTEAFGASMFNWSCLMNNAYKKQPSNPHVHWHCRPRFKNDVSFAGTVFSDPDFAHHYNNKRKRTVDKQVQQQIVFKIKTTISQYLQ